MNRKLVRPLLVAFTFLLAAGVQAQTSKTDTTIKGTVVGADGKPVRAASITCQSSAGIHPRVVHTDAQGHYVITGLKQDSYDVRASADGAYSEWEKNIPLRTGQTKEITLRLLYGNTAISGTLPAKQKH
jgi:Carboxypeptidase regulatory-like domain